MHEGTPWHFPNAGSDRHSVGDLVYAVETCHRSVLHNPHGVPHGSGPIAGFRSARKHLRNGLLAGSHGCGHWSNKLGCGSNPRRNGDRRWHFAHTCSMTARGECRARRRADHRAWWGETQGEDFSCQIQTATLQSKTDKKATISLCRS